MTFRSLSSVKDLEKCIQEFGTRKVPWVLGVGMQDCQLCHAIKRRISASEALQRKDPKVNFIWFDVNTIEEYIESKIYVDCFPTILAFVGNNLIKGWDGFTFEECSKECTSIDEILLYTPSLA
ncbi:hypothetical protein [Aquidulcibacter sp.]|uniref:hypothetical protein n=1 Tax=Aquidulcibacter sp. TaxID=2052990 RepID=UPI003BA47A11